MWLLGREAMTKPGSRPCHYACGAWARCSCEVSASMRAVADFIGMPRAFPMISIDFLQSVKQVAAVDIP